MTLAPEGRTVCLSMAAAAIAGWLWAPLWVAVLLTAGALFCLNFFRDPGRTPPRDAAAIVSPADGTVVAISPHDDAFLGEPGQRVSIFMSVFNVHVNRAPYAGMIESVTHQPGRFLNAMAAEASEHNEQTRVTMETDHGKLVFTQVAGLVARRIINYCQPNRPVERGERIGLIRFGSRVDVVLPARCSLRVQVGEKVVAGESVLGTWS